MADPELGVGEITMEEGHSLPHMGLDTAGSAQATGLLASEGFPAWKLPWA